MTQTGDNDIPEIIHCPNQKCVEPMYNDVDHHMYWECLECGLEIIWLASRGCHLGYRTLDNPWTGEYGEWKEICKATSLNELYRRYRLRVFS